MRMASILAMLLTVDALGSAACSGQRPENEFEMYDGYRVSNTWQLVDVPATRIHLQVWDAGWPFVSHLRSISTVDFDIPDSCVAPLPFEFQFDDVPCKYLTATPPVARLKQTAHGTLRVLPTVPTGFVAEYEVVCDGASLNGTGILRSVGSRRGGVWPYSHLRPGESREEKFLQTLNDAWNGAL